VEFQKKGCEKYQQYSDAVKHCLFNLPKYFITYLMFKVVHSSQQLFQRN